MQKDTNELKSLVEKFKALSEKASKKYVATTIRVGAMNSQLNKKLEDVSAFLENAMVELNEELKKQEGDKQAYNYTKRWLQIYHTLYNAIRKTFNVI